jgi:hypothetical protein
MTSGRNSIGVEVDKSFQQTICPIARHIVDFSNNYLHDRLIRHFEFVKNRIQNSKPLKYTNKHYDCPVVTSQEQCILLNSLNKVQACGDNIFEVMYSAKPQGKVHNLNWNFKKASESLTENKIKDHKERLQLDLLNAQ